MVTKIQPPAEQIINTLMYNELKMCGPEGVLSEEELKEFENVESTGHIIATRNVPELSDLENEFARLRLLNRKNSKGRPLTNPGFHMSINPSESEAGTSEAQILAFVDDLMKGLGYGESPYRLYKHTDIDRVHYHVIATRIGQDGKKINDSFENRRCNTLTEILCQQYGFTLGRDDSPSEIHNVSSNRQEDHRNEPKATVQENMRQSISQTETAPEKPAKKTNEFVPPYKHGEEGSVDDKLKAIHNDTMRWYFSTPEQYVAILKYRYNTTAEIIGNSFSFQGLDKDGEPAHEPRPEMELGLDALAQVTKKCLETDMRKRKSQRDRVNKAAKESAEQAASWNEFKKMMSQRGIYTVISWSEQDDPFGVTWLDRATKCAFKGSETEATIAWIKEIAQQKGWKITRDRRYEKVPKTETKVKSIRKIRRLSTKEGISHLARITAVGHTHGTTTSATYNKDKLKREDEEERNDIVL